MPYVNVICDNPEFNYSTDLAKNITEQEAREYFVNTRFTKELWGKEVQYKCIDIEYNYYTFEQFREKFSNINIQDGGAGLYRVFSKPHSEASYFLFKIDDINVTSFSMGYYTITMKNNMHLNNTVS